MKRILIVILLTIGFTPLFSQFLSFGPRVGISSSKIQVDERFMYNDEQITYISEGSSLGFHIGAYSRLSFGMAYLQPELLFTSAGGEISINSDSKGKEIQNLKYNKIDVPILVGIKAGGVLRLQAGPTFSLLLSNAARNANTFSEVKQNYNNATVGYQAGIGIDISKLSIDLKYEGSLSKTGNSIKIGDEDFNTDFRNSLIMVVLGYNIL